MFKQIIFINKWLTAGLILLSIGLVMHFLFYEMIPGLIIGGTIGAGAGLIFSNLFKKKSKNK